MTMHHPLLCDPRAQISLWIVETARCPRCQLAMSEMQARSGALFFMCHLCRAAFPFDHKKAARWLRLRRN